MPRARHLVPGQLPDGSWESPKDLRCVGGPADGQWFSSPPKDYRRVEVRGGAVWMTSWCGTCANGGVVATYPHSLPDEGA